MNLARDNSRAAIWFNHKCYGIVVCKISDGEQIRWLNSKIYYKKNLSVEYATTGILSEDEIIKNMYLIRGRYYNILDVACNLESMVKPIRVPYIDTHFKEFNDSLGAIARMNTLLTAKRITIPDELKPVFQPELDTYHPVENQTPLISALLMCILQVEEFFEQMYY